MMLEVNKKSKMGGICPSFLFSYFDGCMVHGFMLKGYSFIWEGLFCNILSRILKD